MTLLICPFFALKEGNTTLLVLSERGGVAQSQGIPRPCFTGGDSDYIL